MKCDCDTFSDDPCPSHGYGTMECECGVAIKAPLVVREGYDAHEVVGYDAARDAWRQLRGGEE